MMKRLFALAAFLLASTAAQAQYTFDYGGRTIRIDPDRGTVSIPGVYDNSGRRKRHSDRDSDRPRKPAPEQAKVEPQAPAQPDTTPSAAAPANTTPDPATTTANVAPADTAPAPPPPANTPAAMTAPAPQDTAPAVAPSAPAPAVVTAPPPPPPPPAPAQKQAAAAPTATVQPSNTPLGLWLTEEKEGQVRIEQCGANLCGYSVDKKSNQNGEQVLINMKPGKDAKWSGRILDPNTGSTYDSTLAMKGSDTLRVQGCALGGMFCGGQTWSRVN
jgi:uncharacterized protein (DUF2147 family)